MFDHPHNKNFSLQSLDFPMFQLVSVGCPPSAVHLWFCLFHTHLLGGNKILSKPLLLKVEQIPSFSLFDVLCSNALKLFVALHWTCSRMSRSYLRWRGQNWTLYPRCHLIGVKQRKCETSLDLLDCILANTGQGAVGILCCQIGWLILFLLSRTSSFLQGCLWPVSPQPVLLLGAIPGPMQDFAFAFVDLHGGGFHQPIFLLCE